MSTPTPKKRAINGVLLLDKPVGVSSNTALQQARRLFAAQKAGHTGVLDPLATGLLPLCFGEATKFAQYLLDADKAYIATLQLGTATTTGDAEGEVIAQGRSDIGLAEFQAACAALTGSLRQVPPMFSALKHEGRPLYEYARRGITLERKARSITVYQINLLEFAPPRAVLAVRCSKGTYIRTLAEDLARQLGSYAHLTALRRTATAGFSIDEGHTLALLAALDEAGRDALLLPCDALVRHLPALTADAATVADLQCGRRARLAGGPPAGQPLRIYGADGWFVGLAAYRPEGYLQAVRLMNTAVAA